MKTNKRYTTIEERERLLSLYYDSDITVEEFCLRHGIALSTFYKWKKKYGQNIGSESRPGMRASSKATEEELRQEVLKLRIENERLKKNYMVRKTPDGKMEYIRLKVRNMK